MWLSSLRLLAATPKSRSILEEKLRQRGFAPQAVKNVLDRLETQGLLNDRSFAESVFQSYLYAKPSGRKRIAFELERKGVPTDLIQEMIGRYTAEEECSRARELAIQKKNKLKNLDPRKRRKRIYDFLVRRGFDFSICREITNEIEAKGIFEAET